MRKWHRWLSVFFGVFLLWIAVTGTLSQVVPLYIDATSSAPAAGAPQPEVACPEGYTCRPKPKDGDPRAGFGVYDAGSQVVEIYRTPYPIEKTQARIREAGLPEALAQRLAIGR